MIQPVIHYFLHFIFPGILSYVFYRDKWKNVYLVFLLTMLVDLDHLFATPVFQACRCSIDFHPLHSYYAIAVYFLLLFYKPTRIIAIGLLLHMATDGLDCWMSAWNCHN